MEACVLAFQKLTKKTILLIALLVLAFLIGCGAKTEQRLGVIAIAEEDRALIDLGSIDKVKNGDKVLVYREAKLTHPVSGEKMGTVRDEISKFKVEDVQMNSSNTLENVFGKSESEDIQNEVATIRFSDEISVKEEDKVKLVDRVEEAEPKRVQPIGEVIYFDPESKIAEVSRDSTVDVKVGDKLTVGIYLHKREPLSTFGEVRKLSEVEVTSLTKSKIICRALASRQSEFPEIGDPVVKLMDDKIIFWYSRLEDYRNQNYNRCYRKAIRKYEDGEYWQAVELLNRAENYTSDLNKADVYYLLGSSYKHLGIYDKAEMFLQKSIEFNSLVQKSRVELAYMYLSQNRLKEAAIELKKLSELMPDNSAVSEDIEKVNALGRFDRAQ